MTWLERAQAAGVEGFLHPCEMDQLVVLATNREVVEIGSFKGLSAWGMAHVAKSVHCIDTFRANSAGTIQQEELTTFEAFEKAVSGFSNVSWFVGNSQEGAAACRRKKFDMVFLDADHSYEAVKADIKTWWPRLKKGGVFVFHDCYKDHGYFPGVYQAVNEMVGEPEGCEITLAWVVKK